MKFSILCALILFCSCGSIKPYKCPNGEVVVLTTESDLLLLNKTRDKIYKLASEIMANVEVSSESKEEITNVIKELDAYNTSYYLTILSADNLLRKRPCNELALRNYIKSTDEARRFLNELQKQVISKMEDLKENSGLGGSSYEQFIYIAKTFIKKQK